MSRIFGDLTVYLAYPETVTVTLAKITFSHGVKITEKVWFNITSEASYIYILSDQKFYKNVKNGQFLRTVLPDMSVLLGQKLNILTIWNQTFF